jgi:hypothetical protein
MSWRSLLRRALAGGAALVLMGHSPYRQWAVFRETHLIIAVSDDTPGAFAVSEMVARSLAAHVRHSKALATLARSDVEVAKLLGSRQLPLGLFLGDDAADALQARGRFAGEAPLPLRALAVLGPYLLVALEDFPAEKAGEIARSLDEHPPDGVPAGAGPAASPVPLHPGVPGARQDAPGRAGG